MFPMNSDNDNDDDDSNNIREKYMFSWFRAVVDIDKEFCSSTAAAATNGNHHSSSRG